MTDVLKDVVVGVAGTGMMGSAHAFRHTAVGFPMMIGSRDPQKAQQLATEIEQQLTLKSAAPRVRFAGASYKGMVERANFIILAIPATELRNFIDAYREDIVSKKKCFMDLPVTFSRYGSSQVLPPTTSDGPNWRGPYFDMINYLSDRLNDPSTGFVKAWHNLYFKSIMNNKVQPVECGGHPRAKAIAMAMMAKEGWEPLDCGGMEDLLRIETGFHESRVRDPIHLEFDGPNHP
ncbi:unnamed protein product [Amoebophrya sp. A25]|nr:unnamed protein product [Amoebophrya sp. A25]|eukprot:GSA25T00012041001.1